MSRRGATVAIASVVVAALVILWRAGYGAAIGLPWPGSIDRPDGPPVPGARGKLAYVRNGDVYVFDLVRGTERRLTRQGGASTPRWAGSGGWLSYEREGKLWVMKADGSGTFAPPGGDQPATARWSPRSTHIAYASADGSVSVLEPSNGPKGRRIVVPAGSGAGPALAWDADVTRVAYERHQRAGEGVSNEGIWSVDINGRSPVPVFLASGDYSLRLCCWGTGGQYVYFWQGPISASIAADGLPLFVARALSSQPVQVSPVALVHPEWVDSAARADAIAFIAGAGREMTAAKSLSAVSPQPGTGGVTSLRVVPLEESPSLAPAYPAWGPENTYVAYSVGPSLTAAGGDLAASLANRRIWLVKPENQQKRALLSDATVPSGVSDERPVWARDGKTLIFVRRLQPEAAVRGTPGPAPGGVELWISVADGSNARRVVGGFADPGIGDHGYIPWEETFDYYRG